MCCKIVEAQKVDMHLFKKKGGKNVAQIKTTMVSEQTKIILNVSHYLSS